MSLEHLENFERAIRPAEFIGDSEREATLRDGMLIASCPSCQSELWTLPSGFLCSNRECSFRAGSVLDYVATEFGDVSFEQAVRSLWSSYKDKLDFFTAFSPADVIPGIAQAARLRRRLFERFLLLNLRPSPTTATLASARGMITSWGINGDANSMSVLPASAAQVNELREIAQQYGCREGVPDAGGVVFPFFGNHHSVSEVMIWSLATKRFYHLSFLPFKFGFNGLLEGSPQHEHLVLGNKVEAARSNSFFATYAAHKVAVGLCYNRLGTMPAIALPTPCYMFDPGEPLGGAAAYAQATPGLKVKPFQANSQDSGVPATPWAAFMIKEATAKIAEEGFSNGAVSLIDSAKLSTADLGRLITALRLQGLYAEVEALESHIQKAAVFQQDGWSLFSTHAGYLVSKGDDVRRAATNFTLEFKTKLVFTDSPDLFHSGFVVFQGSRYPILLDHRHLDNTKDLEAVVRGAEAKQAKTDESDMLPAVVDRKGLGVVAAHLRAVTSQLPRSHGLSYLGWNNAKNRFCGPSWQVKDGKTFDMPFIFHPDIEVLRFFSNELLTDQIIKGKLQSGLCGMIAQLTAMVARSFLDLPIHPIKIADSPAARSTLKALFAGLGQKEVYRLSLNARYAEEIRHLKGFPIFAAGYSASQIDRSTLPAFILSETGSPMRGDPTEAELQFAADVLRKAVQAVAEWMLATDGKEFVRQQSISNDVELTREGQDLLRSVCGWNWPDAPIRYQMLERLLQSIPAAHVSQFFQHHLVGQKVYFAYRAFEKTVDITTLELELRSRCESFSRTQSFFVLDALTANQILNNYYQEQAFPDPIADPPLDPSSPSQSITPSIGGLG